MATFQQLRSGFHNVLDSLTESWQRLYRRAANAITEFRPGKAGDNESQHELAVRNSGWGLLAAEVYDDDKKVVVRIEAPGMTKDDFDIEVVHGYLVIRGEKRVERESSQGEYRITECAYGQFERAIPLPDEVQASKAVASYKKGVLRVEMPRSGQRRDQRRVIDVR